jgi:hypothetical protein
MKDELARTGLDITSIGAMAAVLAGHLPSIAAAVTIIWTGLRCYEIIISIREKRIKKRRSPRKSKPKVTNGETAN